MKKLFVIIIAALISYPALSQVNFGLKVGISSTTVPTYEFTTGENNIDALKNAAYGYHAGAFVRITIMGVYIMPEVVFASTTYDYNVTTVSMPETLISQKFDKLEIPLLVGFKLGPVRLNAGPSAAILINTPKDLITDPDFANLYRSATFGYQAGIGVDLFKKLAIDLRYGGSLSKKFGDSVSIGNQTFNLDHREPSVLLSLGLMF